MGQTGLQTQPQNKIPGQTAPKTLLRFSSPDPHVLISRLCSGLVLVYAAVAQQAGRSPRGVAARPAGTCRAACAAPGTTRPTGPRPPFAARAQPRQSWPGLTARPCGLADLPLQIAATWPPCGYRFACVAAGHQSAACGRGALAARRVLRALCGGCRVSRLS